MDERHGYPELEGRELVGRDEVAFRGELELACAEAEADLRAIPPRVLYALRKGDAGAESTLSVVARQIAACHVIGDREPTAIVARRFAFDVLGSPALSSPPGAAPATIAEAIIRAAAELVHDHLRGVAADIIGEHEATLEDDIAF
jgi:hypothetical protein